MRPGALSLQNAYFGFAGNSTATGIQNAALGSHALVALTTGSTNAAFGALALTANTTGSGNSALGDSALSGNTTGQANTAVGFQAMQLNTSGSFNTAVGDVALPDSMIGSYNTGLGYSSGNTSGGLYGSGNTFLGSYTGTGGQPNMTNATAIGYKAVVNESNAMVLGQPGTFVGIGTSVPTNPLTIQADDNGQGRGGVPHQLQIQGATNSNKQLLIGYFADTLSDSGYGTIQATDSGVQNTWLSLQPVGGTVVIAESVAVHGNPLEIAQGKGPAVADGWATFSSRRWKTNIETLHGALGKVEKMRGVSYDLKATGKHEIGVIAEEVGAVVPEVVTWEKNGKDAESVDYSRMVALLIESVKEQQALIHKQQTQIRAQQKQIAAQRAQMTQVMSHVKGIESSLSLARQAAGQNAGQQVMAELRAAPSSR